MSNSSPPGTNKEILRMMIGFRKFRERFFHSDSPLYSKLSSIGQSPKTLVIGCSDSRVDPAILTTSSPGDLFVIRNVANLVPPFDITSGFHGVSSAIEFAVINLKVENVVILGHRQCGGIRGLVQSPQTNSAESFFLSRWMQIAEPARLRAIEKFPDADEDSLCRHCEMESIKTSLQNLRTFPFVEEAIKTRGMNLLGTYFDLELGHLFVYDDELGEFTVIAI